MYRLFVSVLDLAGVSQYRRYAWNAEYFILCAVP